MDSEVHLLKISDAAKALGISTSTLRRWEVQGFIQSVRTKGGHRRYRSSDIERMYQQVNQSSGIHFS